MSSRLNRMWLMPFLLLGAQAWALGLGDIRLSSALNEPLRAEVELLAATPEELNNLSIQLAPSDTFARYDLDRPLYLTRLKFDVVRSGRADGNVVRISSTEPMTEPFITFLVEASWSRGRLLREYTVLLDPPTFAPPPTTQTTQTVTAPSRTTPADSGQIQRPAPQPQSTPAPARPSVQSPAQSQSQPTPGPSRPTPANQPRPSAPLGQTDFDSTPGGDLVIQRGDTLWSITNRVRPDSRLTMNQTMLAIYEANPQAFDDNINLMRAGATLRIPSADDVFRISRGDALAEVQRQNSAWSGISGVAAVDPRPSLTLVPPDQEDDIDMTDTSVGTGATDLADMADDEPADAEEDTFDDEFVDPVDNRILEIEGILDDQDALLEIPDNELAALRNELAELRGEEVLADVDEDLDDAADDDVLFDDELDDGLADDELPVDDSVAEDDSTPAVVTRPTQDEGILDTIMGYVTNFWVIIGSALVIAILVLIWFMRRAGGDDEVTGVWETLDADDIESDSVASTEQLRALAQDDDDSFVVVETESTQTSEISAVPETMEMPVVSEPAPSIEAPGDPVSATGVNRSIEETFSSETAINLDQSDPVAEADFHMAYGLYDQAADLINGALAADPDRQDLLAKLCEIYFVWGNRDAFIDGAGRMKTLLGGEADPDWDKIVIMGQQIAADHELFSGVSAEGATKAVDLSFEGGTEDAGELDIDFAGGPDGAISDVIDLGAESAVGDETGQVLIADDSGEGIDFAFDEEPDTDMSITREMPEPTVESPTIEEQFQMEATGEVAAISGEHELSFPPADATAEIDLDDLGLDLDGLDETVAANDVGAEPDFDDLEDTASGEALDVADDPDATGSNLAINDDFLDATGENEELVETGRNPALDMDDVDDVSDATGLQEVLAATAEMPSADDIAGVGDSLGDDEATLLASLDDDDNAEIDVGIDTSLLDATGQTQILTEDMAVDTAANLERELADDEATTLAPALTGDDGEFDFAKTEALPKDVFSSDMSTDETGTIEQLAGGTDMDLDLDDLTAALKVSEVGDTVNQVRDDATVEQPRIRPQDAGPGEDGGHTAITQALAPEDLSGDLHEARTMTEVGTKLDLARAYVDMGDPGGARSILEEVIDEGDEGQKQQAQQLLESLPS